MNNVYRRASLITVNVKTKKSSIEQFEISGALGKLAPKGTLTVSNYTPVLGETIVLSIDYTDNDNKYLDRPEEAMTVSWSFTGDNVSVLTATGYNATFMMNSTNFITLTCLLTDAHGNTSEYITLFNETTEDVNALMTELNEYITTEDGVNITI